jgi:cytochrome oxidase Cu insertion factor (SCO1/SenC/PrrC family)
MSGLEPPQHDHAIRVGLAAPGFTLSSPDGATPITLRDLRGKPTVLVFGSCTCPPFVRSTAQVSRLMARYGDRVHFLLVYIREAHPTDGWAIEGNAFEVATPRTMDERRSVARAFRSQLDLAIPIVVDTIDDQVAAMYDPFPNRMVILDADGTVVLAEPSGPQSTLNSARRAAGVLDSLLASPLGGTRSADSGSH